MIRAVFFDLDGTLFSHKTERIPDSTLKAMHLLQEKGIRTVLCTGRHISELRELGMLSFPYDGYVLLNGQISLDQDMNIVASSPFEGEAKESVLRIFREKKIPIMIFEKERVYLSFVNEYVKEAQAAVHTSVAPVEEYYGDDFYMCVGYFDKDMPERIPGCVTASWYDGAADIFPEGGGKEKGMEGYLNTFGISRDEIMAFGDGENDAGMLKYAAIGVAMGNACEMTKEAADHVTADIDDDGIMKALVHYGIL